MLARDESSGKVYNPLLSIKVIKQTKELLYVHLDIKNGLKIEALLDSAAYVNVMVETELDSTKQQAPWSILETDVPLNSSNTSGEGSAGENNNNCQRTI